jgi:putative hydrolase of the HAD superfamily
MEEKTQIKAVIFDMGGVFLRTEDRQPRLRLAEKYGLTPQGIESLVFDSETHHLAEKGILTAEDHWQSVGKQLHLDAEQSREFRQQFFAGDRLDRDLLAWISSLRSQFRTAMLSNAWSDLRQVLSRMGGVLECFDQVFISSEVGMAKPDPKIFQHVLTNLQVSPDEAVFTDDFKHNIEGAAAVGIHAVHFLSPEQARREIGLLLRLNS